MTNPDEMVSASFRDSHLLAKPSRTLVLARIYEGPGEESSIAHFVGGFHSDSAGIQRQGWNDYNVVRDAIKSRVSIPRRGRRVSRPSAGLSGLGMEDNHGRSTPRHGF